MALTSPARAAASASALRTAFCVASRQVCGCCSLAPGGRLGIKSYGSAEAAMTLPLSAFRTRTLVDCVPLSMPIRSVRIKSSRLDGGQNGDRERRCPIRTEGFHRLTPRGLPGRLTELRTRKTEREDCGVIVGRRGQFRGLEARGRGGAPGEHRFLPEDLAGGRTGLFGKLPVGGRPSVCARRLRAGGRSADGPFTPERVPPARGRRRGGRTPRWAHAQSGHQIGRASCRERV